MAWLPLQWRGHRHNWPEAACHEGSPDLAHVLLSLWRKSSHVAAFHERVPGLESEARPEACFEEVPPGIPSVSAQHDEIGQPAQTSGLLTECAQRLERRLPQLASQFARGREAKEAHVRRLVLARVLARGLLDEGGKASVVAKEVARRLALPRNTAYRIVQEIAEA